MCGQMEGKNYFKWQFQNNHVQLAISGGNFGMFGPDELTSPAKKLHAKLISENDALRLRIFSSSFRENETKSCSFPQPNQRLPLLTEIATIISH